MELNICQYCQSPAILVKGNSIYPSLHYLHKKYFWLCRPCDAWVGCHPGSSKPLGQLANSELRKARQSAHAAFDPMWRGKSMKRKASYEWLAGHLDISVDECHIGSFGIARCRLVVAICQPKCNENCPRFETGKHGPFCVPDKPKHGYENVTRNQEPGPNCRYKKLP